MEPIRVMIVEDDPDWRNGLASLLEGFPDIRVAALAANAEEARNTARSVPHDVVLMDIMLADSPEGISLTAEIIESAGARVIMLTSLEDKDMIFESFRAGAVDYMVKASFDEIPEAVRNAYRNRSPINARVAEQLRAEFRCLKQFERETEARRMRDMMTPTELEVLRMIDKGLSQPQIAEKLFVSLRTVKVHVGNILRKLGVPSSKEAASLFRRIGLFDEPTNGRDGDAGVRKKVMKGT